MDQQPVAEILDSYERIRMQYLASRLGSSLYLLLEMQDITADTLNTMDPSELEAYFDSSPDPDEDELYKADSSFLSDIRTLFKPVQGYTLFSASDESFAMRRSLPSDDDLDFEEINCKLVDGIWVEQKRVFKVGEQTGRIPTFTYNIFTPDDANILANGLHELRKSYLLVSDEIESS